jgi:3-oxoacyl-[acyl-carrier protein] reductase
MDIRLDGKVALIPGSSKGMGKAMAEKFAASGAQMAIVARRPEPLADTAAAIVAAGGHCRPYAGDVSRADEVIRLFSAITGGLGRVDIPVDNAGRSQAGKFEELTDEIWQGDFDLKVFAAI